MLQMLHAGKTMPTCSGQWWHNFSRCSVGPVPLQKLALTMPDLLGYPMFYAYGNIIILHLAYLIWCVSLTCFIAFILRVLSDYCDIASENVAWWRRKFYFLYWKCFSLNFFFLFRINMVHVFFVYCHCVLRFRFLAYFCTMQSIFKRK